MTGFAVRRPIIVIGSLLIAVTACSTGVESGEPSTTAGYEGGTKVSFRQCADLRDWARPSGKEQIEVMKDARFGGVGVDALRSVQRQDFFVLGASASLRYDLWLLTGLWTLTEDQYNECLEDKYQQALIDGTGVEIWIFDHRMIEIVALEENRYRAVVEPAPQGGQILQIEVASPQLEIVMIDEAGTLLGEISVDWFPT